MRDFGFWVRIVAISQLFSLVLINYGDGWLAPDNPILTVRQDTPRAEAPPPPPPVVDQAKFWNAKPKDFSESRDDGDLAAEGWGGGEEADAPGDDEGGEAQDAELPIDEPEPADDPDWGAG